MSRGSDRGAVRSCAVALALLGAGAAAHAQAPPPAEPSPEAYVLHLARLPAPPTIDGTLAAGEWEEGLLVDHFTQLETHEGEPASERTEVRLGYDAENLYLAARCYDAEPEKIVASVLTRDGDLTYDDAFEVILDTYHDRRSGFLFAVNPLGSLYDATVRQEGEEINADWDGLWRAAATRDEEGWTVEAAIPFRTLRFPRTPEQTWGLNLGRMIARKREQSFWKPLKRAYGFWARYKISEYGLLTGLAQVEQGSPFQLRPYGLLSADRDARGDDDLRFEAGVDLKAHLTSNLVGDLTYNTDFAETEADQEAINLTRFKLFFPEKREFFLEGADLFYFGERPEPYKDAEAILFFSRRIGLAEDRRQAIPVLGGAKLTGKLAATSLGFLTLSTEAATVRDAEGRLVLEPQTNYSALRLRADVLAKSKLGLMALNKAVSGPGDDYRAAGVDGDFAFGEHLKLGGYLAKTETAGTAGDDWAGAADLFWESRRARLRFAVSDIGENFNPELGFFTRTGVRKLRSNLTRIFWPESRRVRQWFLVHYLDYVEDQERRVESRLNNVEMSILNRNSSGIALKVYDQLEVLKEPFEISPGVVIPPGSYDFRYLFFGFQTDYSKPWGTTGRLQVGEFYDGNLWQAFGYVAYHGLAGMWASVNFQRTEADLPAGDFRRDLAVAALDYAWSPALSARGSVQWNRDDALRAKLIVQWIFRPGSQLFVVYDETRDEFTTLSPTFRPFPIDQRRVLLKASYLFDF